MTPGWVMTASGLAFYPLAPRVEDVRLDDIAHALAAVARFGGAAREPYSVAQHSVLVSLEMERSADGSGGGRAWHDGLYGLLHDAAEAYLGDVPRPLKQLEAFAPYREAEQRLQRVIYAAFGLDAVEPARLKTIDRRMLRTEQQFLMPPAVPGEGRDDVAPFPIGIVPWPFRFSKAAFLRRYADLRAVTGRDTPGDTHGPCGRHVDCDGPCWLSPSEARREAQAMRPRATGDAP